MDYKKIGLKAGLEIHQQLDTRKLFCNCPSETIDREGDIKIKRVLFPSFGETGEVDIAALHENKKSKFFIYEAYEDKTCLVELDEEPPKTINKEALRIALIIARLMNMNIFDEIHVMRKTVVDGSNTSGFQRTSLIAEDGFIVLSNGKKVNIESLCIEEDSARKIKESENFVIYRLDRLGVPLVEITTKADLNTPEEVKEAAYKIGLLLRSTKVKRGLGTIRQDVNVSISKGERVEIKGVQNLDLIEEIVKNEAKRQLDLLSLRKELWKRVISKIDLSNVKIYFNDEFEKNINDIKEELNDKVSSDLFYKKENVNLVEEIKEKILNRLYFEKFYSNSNELLNNISKNTKSKLLKNKKLFLLAMDEIFEGLLGREIGLKRFGTELAGVIKQFSFKGLIHSDENLNKYGLSEEEINSLKKISKVFILLAYEDEEKLNLAIDAIFNRISFAFIGVPKETRKANEDGSTSFLRPMPGKARMYPETDLPIFKIKDLIPKDEELPKTLEELEEELSNKIGKELAKQLIKSKRLHLALKLMENSNNPKIVAYLFTGFEKELKRDYNIELSDNEFIVITNLLNKGLINKESLFDLVSSINKELLDKNNLEKLEEEYIKKIEELGLRKLSGEKLKEELEKFISSKRDTDLKKLRADIIKEFRKKADMKELMLLINKLLK